MAYVIIFIVVAAEAGIAWFFFARSVGGQASELRKSILNLETEQKSREELAAKMQALYEKMVPLPTVRANAEEYRTYQESLKAERGRITITQAELETVESRLRELEEIERELEASGLETKEELNILTKKRNELANRNNNLQGQLDTSLKQMDEIMSEIEMSAQLEARVADMKAQLIQIQSKIDQLLIKIEEGNEQYFILKKRYDALDIEYAQLYEKFTAAESQSSDAG